MKIDIYIGISFKRNVRLIKVNVQCWVTLFAMNGALPRAKADDSE
jgi:hypothetical protein